MHRYVQRLGYRSSWTQDERSATLEDEKGTPREQLIQSCLRGPGTVEREGRPAVVCCRGLIDQKKERKKKSIWKMEKVEIRNHAIKREDSKANDKSARSFESLTGSVTPHDPRSVEKDARGQSHRQVPITSTPHQNWHLVDWDMDSN